MKYKWIWNRWLDGFTYVLGYKNKLPGKVSSTLFSLFQFHKHLFVHIGSNASYSDPLLEVSYHVMDSPTGNTTVLTLNTCKKWTTLIQERQPLKFKFSCRRLIYDRSTTNFQRRRADSKNCMIKAHNRRSFLSSSGCVSDSFFFYPHCLTDNYTTFRIVENSICLFSYS